MAARKNIPLRLDPKVYEAIARWAGDETRSVNAQIEYMLRDELRRVGRLPKNLAEPAKPGRPPKTSR
ncbi:MAG: hypothetical protein SPI77_05810 [Corynebacterium sp.]|nr:hypothetical protein [Corynebacterium sp.]